MARGAAGAVVIALCSLSAASLLSYILTVGGFHHGFTTNASRISRLLNASVQGVYAQKGGAGDVFIQPLRGLGPESLGKMDGAKLAPNLDPFAIYHNTLLPQCTQPLWTEPLWKADASTSTIYRRRQKQSRSLQLPLTQLPATATETFGRKPRWRADQLQRRLLGNSNPG